MRAVDSGFLFVLCHKVYEVTVLLCVVTVVVVAAFRLQSVSMTVATYCCRRSIASLQDQLPNSLCLVIGALTL
jgi:hypothetical protein